MQNQDLEALWSIVFFSPGNLGGNAAVVALETGRIFGGDSWYYYTGTYETKTGKLTARVKTTHYAGPASSALMGSLEQGNIEFVEVGRGTDPNGNRTLRLSGTLIETPTQKVAAELTWRERLP